MASAAAVQTERGQLVSCKAEPSRAPLLCRAVWSVADLHQRSQAEDKVEGMFELSEVWIALLAPMLISILRSARVLVARQRSIQVHHGDPGREEEVTFESKVE